MNPYEYHPESPDPAPPPNLSPGSDDPQRDAIVARTIQLCSQAAPLRKRLESGANWFYWIAGLTIVNSLMLHFNAERTFCVGLATTLIVDIIGLAARPQNGDVAVAVAVAVNAVIVSLVALTGWLGNRGWRSVMGLGMALYVLDGILFLWIFQDFLSAGFHAFALWNMWNGFSAAGELEGIEAELTHLSYLLPQEAQIQPPLPSPAPYFPQG